MVLTLGEANHLQVGAPFQHELSLSGLSASSRRPVSNQPFFREALVGDLSARSSEPDCGLYEGQEVEYDLQGGSQW